MRGGVDTRHSSDYIISKTSYDPSQLPNDTIIPSYSIYRPPSYTLPHNPSLYTLKASQAIASCFSSTVSSPNSGPVFRQHLPDKMPFSIHFYHLFCWAYDSTTLHFIINKMGIIIPTQLGCCGGQVRQ